jgi:hypothetical protein
MVSAGPPVIAPVERSSATATAATASPATSAVASTAEILFVMSVRGDDDGLTNS